MPRIFIGILVLACALLTAKATDTNEENKRCEFLVYGLFCPERLEDFKKTVADVPEFKLVSVDYETDVAVIDCANPNKVFDGVDWARNPDEAIRRINDRLARHSNHTFGARPLPKVAPDKLVRLEIKIQGLDCLGCAFEVYMRTMDIPGVVRETVSFKTGQIVAIADPKVTRADYEKVFKTFGYEWILVK